VYEFLPHYADVEQCCNMLANNSTEMFTYWNYSYYTEISAYWIFEYYTTSSTGWMSIRGLSTSLVWWCTSVCMTGRLGTSLITSSQPLMLLLAVFIYDPLTWIVSLFLAADLAHMAVGLFITLARQASQELNARRT